jgi:hypothetical protein
MPTTQQQLSPGVYNSEYFSGAQVCLYIGDTWIDEVVSLSFQVSQSRSPIYGYSSILFDDISVGNVLVQGEMTINFKEAGYLWLILARHGKLQYGVDVLDPNFNAKNAAQSFIGNTNMYNVLNNGTNQSLTQKNTNIKVLTAQVALAQTQAQNNTASVKTGNQFNTSDYQTMINSLQGLLWGQAAQSELDKVKTRRADDPKVNPFDLYITYGDITGPAGVHSTIQKLKNVYIIGTSKTITLEGIPILETYSFIAQDLI